MRCDATCNFAIEGGGHGEARSLDLGGADLRFSSHIILGVYLIIFGLGKEFVLDLTTTVANCNHRHCAARFVISISRHDLCDCLRLAQSSRFPSKWHAMRRLCSLSLAVESVSTYYLPGQTTLIALVYIFIGSVIVGEKWFRIVPGTLVGIIGIGYAALEFVPSIEPPANMRDADAGWGAEQV